MGRWDIVESDLPLRKLRKKHRILLSEISRSSRIDSAALSRIENGWKEMTAKHIACLVEGYVKLQIAPEEISDVLLKHVEKEMKG